MKTSYPVRKALGEILGLTGEMFSLPQTPLAESPLEVPRGLLISKLELAITNPVVTFTDNPWCDALILLRRLGRYTNRGTELYRQWWTQVLAFEVGDVECFVIALHECLGVPDEVWRKFAHDIDARTIELLAEVDVVHLGNSNNVGLMQLRVECGILRPFESLQRRRRSELMAA